jgi:hypothetical protein
MASRCGGAHAPDVTRLAVPVNSLHLHTAYWHSETGMGFLVTEIDDFGVTPRPGQCRGTHDGSADQRDSASKQQDSSVFLLSFSDNGLLPLC